MRESGLSSQDQPAGSASGKAVSLRHNDGVNLADYALFWPGVVVAVVVAAAISVPLARAMGRPWAVAFGLTFSIGVIAAATLTPGRDALLFGIPGSGSCDLSAIALPGIASLRTLNDTSLNVLLFVPLGMSVALAGSTRRALTILVASIAIPFAIEAIQLIATPLGRSCQGVDVVDNLTGLTIGFGSAWLVGVLGRRIKGATARTDAL